MKLGLAQALMPLLVGIFFVVSYFLSDKHFFFEFIAYLPMKRKGSVKIGSLIFGIIFILISIYNFYKWSK